MRWRYLLVTILVLVPIAVLLVVGGWSLWETGRLVWLLWLIPFCWGIAYFVARQSPQDFATADTGIDPPLHWTQVDQEALKLVEAKQRAVAELSPSDLTRPGFYLDTATELAMEIAQHYWPQSKDPLGSVTIVEILAVSELAIQESAQWVDEYVPASHLLTVDQWRTLSKAPGWFRTIGDLTWVSSLILNPAGVLRHISAKLAASSATQQFQQNIIASFYVAFVRFAGIYLIEMNSGRLRGGAERYRQLKAKLLERKSKVKSSDREPRAADDPSAEVTVTVSLVGQVNSGKSSLVNALLGERQAATDILPATRQIERFRLDLADASDRLVLLDTPGYGEDGAAAAQIEEIRVAIAQSDLILLVLDVNHAARKPDVEVMSMLKKAADLQPQLRLPPVLGVLTHIDGLRPVMEWSPPYDWLHPTGAKEQTIHDAVEYNRHALGEVCQGMIPVCTDFAGDRVFGVEQWLLPAMTALLDEATACSLLRSLHAEVSRSRVDKIFRQLRAAGFKILKASVMDVSPKNKGV